MNQYWARHEGRFRWGVVTPLETGEHVYTSQTGVFFVWADRVEIEGGSLVFRNHDGALRAALGPGRWDAVFEAAPDDTAQAVETR